MHQAVNTGRQGVTRGASHRLSSPYHQLEALRPGSVDMNSTQPRSPQKDKQQHCPAPPPRDHRLQHSLYFGSAFPSEVPRKTDPSSIPQLLLNTPEEVQATWFMQNQHNRLATSGQYSIDWNSDMSPSSPVPYADSQHTFLAAHASSPTNADPNTYATGKHKGKKQQATQVSRRPTSQDFEYLARDPSGHQNMLAQYVGTDSKYTLASNHAAIMVRQSVRSSDFSHRLKEATISLASIAELVEFTYSKEDLKPEQRGCLALRVCFSALTALMGDFSSGEIPLSDPNVPIVPRHALGTFRQCYSPIVPVVAKLVEKLVKSINMYRHRRSPSASVVTKFQAMLRTLEAWNAALQDGTFQEPTSIIINWLANHPSQVSSIQRAPSVQSSPSMSETVPSPVQVPPQLTSNPAALLSQYPYSEPMSQPRRSSHSNTRNSTLHSSMAHAGHQASSYDTGSLFPNPQFPNNLTYYPATTLPATSTDMHGTFPGIESMYDDYIPQSAGQSSYPSSMYGYRQG
ncbi:hypothetical protein BDV93DRAFT_511438 [Ceratobasidium sp. AG-I]|nr:hypothetical protein BDV93DRAFT_511438 [Ceratobasidium sp. AG-I]